MALALVSEIIPLRVSPAADRCDECGEQLAGHRARCSRCGAELCLACDAELAWEARPDPAGPSLCGWCLGPEAA